MAEIKSLLANVKEDFRSMSHHRNAYSMSYPYQAMPAASSLPRSSTAVFENAITEAQNVNKEQLDRPHTGTPTCLCKRCVMPGNLTREEFERHVSNKIEAGRREMKTIDDQIDYCYELLGLLDVIDEKAARLKGESQDEAVTSTPIQQRRPPTSRRQTTSGLPFTPGTDPTQDMKRPATTNLTATLSLPLASEQSIRKDVHSSPATIRAGLRLPARSSLLSSGSTGNLANSTRLSLPSFDNWRDEGQDGYEIDETHAFSTEGATYFDQNHNSGHSIGYQAPFVNVDKPLPPIQRTFTPRTESTTELLGSLGSDLLLPENGPYSSPHSRTSSIFHRRKAVLAEDFDPSESKTPQHSDSWQRIRAAGVRAKQKRRHSKADELLGFHSPASVSRVSSVLGSSETLEEQVEGKKSKLSLLKLSKLRKPKSEI